MIGNSRWGQHINHDSRCAILMEQPQISRHSSITDPKNL